MVDTAPHVLEPLSPQRLFHIMAGFKTTAVLRTGIELGVFDVFVDGSRTAAQVAGQLGLDPRGTRLLLGALAGAGLLAESDGGQRYTLPPGGAELLVSSSPKYAGGIAKVASSQGEWDALGRLTQTVREGGPVPGADAVAPGFAYWNDFATHTTFGTQRGAALLADAVHPWFKALPTPRVLDVGCGHGLYGFELACRHPDARIVSQDWEPVLDVAAHHASRLGVRERVELLAGDVREIDPGGPYDLIVVANLLFHFSPEQAAALLKQLAGALKPEGRIAVVGFTTGDAAAAEQEHAHLLGLLMLSWTQEGEMHSTADHQAMLSAAGLTQTEYHTRPGLPLSVLVAKRA